MNLTERCRLLALDVALAHTGWAVLEADGAEIEDWGVIDVPVASGAHCVATENFRRVGLLSDGIESLLARFQKLGNLTVVIEHTDWMPGESGDREDWIRESKARSSLGLALATAFLACRGRGIEPLHVGANEWQTEFGARDQKLGERTIKQRTAYLVALEFPATFEAVWKETRRSLRNDAGAKARSAVIDRATGREVPDHVTDAIAMALVLRRRLVQETRLGENDAQD